ncbi:hypothetical protein F4805DRAFT_192799 [Annulohypoxylon moriforme]|nr:hypothetical protein F4805DRAFT_192799 [Annulohypoxylon moriforme]
MDGYDGFLSLPRESRNFYRSNVPGPIRTSAQATPASRSARRPPTSSWGGPRSSGHPFRYGYNDEYQYPTAALAHVSKLGGTKPTPNKLTPNKPTSDKPKMIPGPGVGEFSSNGEYWGRLSVNQQFLNIVRECQNDFNRRDPAGFDGTREQTQDLREYLRRGLEALGLEDKIKVIETTSTIHGHPTMLYSPAFIKSNHEEELNTRGDNEGWVDFADKISGSSYGSMRGGAAPEQTFVAGRDERKEVQLPWTNTKKEWSQLKKDARIPRGVLPNTFDELPRKGPLMYPGADFGDDLRAKLSRVFLELIKAQTAPFDALKSASTEDVFKTRDRAAAKGDADRIKLNTFLRRNINRKKKDGNRFILQSRAIDNKEFLDALTAGFSLRVHRIVHLAAVNRLYEIGEANLWEILHSEMNLLRTLRFHEELWREYDSFRLTDWISNSGETESVKSRIELRSALEAYWANRIGVFGAELEKRDGEPRPKPGVSFPAPVKPSRPSNATAKNEGHAYVLEALQKLQKTYMEARAKTIAENEQLDEGDVGDHQQIRLNNIDIQAKNQMLWSLSVEIENAKSLTPLKEGRLGFGAKHRMTMPSADDYWRDTKRILGDKELPTDIRTLANGPLPGQHPMPGLPKVIVGGTTDLGDPQPTLTDPAQPPINMLPGYTTDQIPAPKSAPAPKQAPALEQVPKQVPKQPQPEGDQVWTVGQILRDLPGYDRLMPAATRSNEISSLQVWSDVFSRAWTLRAYNNSANPIPLTTRWNIDDFATRRFRELSRRLARIEPGSPGGHDIRYYEGLVSAQASYIQESRLNVSLAILLSGCAIVRELGPEPSEDNPQPPVARYLLTVASFLARGSELTEPYRDPRNEVRQVRPVDPVQWSMRDIATMTFDDYVRTLPSELQRDLREAMDKYDVVKTTAEEAQDSLRKIKAGPSKAPQPQPQQPAWPTRPTRPTRPARPVQPVQPVQPAQPVRPVRPVQPTQHAPPAQPKLPRPPLPAPQPKQPTVQPKQPAAQPKQPTAQPKSGRPTQPGWSTASNAYGPRQWTMREIENSTFEEFWNTLPLSEQHDRRAAYDNWLFIKDNANTIKNGFPAVTQGVPEAQGPSTTGAAAPPTVFQPAAPQLPAAPAAPQPGVPKSVVPTSADEGLSYVPSPAPVNNGGVRGHPSTWTWREWKNLGPGWNRFFNALHQWERDRYGYPEDMYNVWRLRAQRRANRQAIVPFPYPAPVPAQPPAPPIKPPTLPAQPPAPPIKPPTLPKQPPAPASAPGLNSAPTGNLNQPSQGKPEQKPHLTFGATVHYPKLPSLESELASELDPEDFDWETDNDDGAGPSRPSASSKPQDVPTAGAAAKYKFNPDGTLAEWPSHWRDNDIAKANANLYLRTIRKNQEFRERLDAIAEKEGIDLGSERFEPVDMDKHMATLDKHMSKQPVDTGKRKLSELDGPRDPVWGTSSGDSSPSDPSDSLPEDSPKPPKQARIDSQGVGAGVRPTQQQPNIVKQPVTSAPSVPASTSFTGLGPVTGPSVPPKSGAEHDAFLDKLDLLASSTEVPEKPLEERIKEAFPPRVSNQPISVPTVPVKPPRAPAPGQAPSAGNTGVTSGSSNVPPTTAWWPSGTKPTTGNKPPQTGGTSFWSLTGKPPGQSVTGTKPVTPKPPINKPTPPTAGTKPPTKPPTTGSIKPPITPATGPPPSAGRPSGFGADANKPTSRPDKGKDKTTSHVTWGTTTPLGPGAGTKRPAGEDEDTANAALMQVIPQKDGWRDLQYLIRAYRRAHVAEQVLGQRRAGQAGYAAPVTEGRPQYPVPVWDPRQDIADL